MTNSQLGQSALRRLMAYQARLEGAQMGLKAAQEVVNALSENYLVALRSACEDAEVPLPPPGVQTTVNVDFITGNVTVVPVLLETGNGSVVPGPMREPGN